MVGHFMIQQAILLHQWTPKNMWTGQGKSAVQHMIPRLRRIIKQRREPLLANCKVIPLQSGQ